MPDAMDRAAFLAKLTQDRRVEFADSVISAPNPDPVAENLRGLIAEDERISYAFQVGEWTRGSQRREEWLGDVVWYLATNRAVLTVSLSAKPQGSWTYTVIRCRQWLLSQILWLELEDTYPASPEAPSCRLTVRLEGDETLAINSSELGANEEQAVLAMRHFATALSER